MGERLFSKGDIVLQRVHDRHYQIGKVIFEKEKLLQINSKLAAFVEIYEYRTGIKSLVGYHKLQEYLESGAWRKINYLEKKNFKK